MSVFAQGVHDAPLCKSVLILVESSSWILSKIDGNSIGLPKNKNQDINKVESDNLLGYQEKY